MRRYRSQGVYYYRYVYEYDYYGTIYPYEYFYKVEYQPYYYGNEQTAFSSSSTTPGGSTSG